MDARGDPGSDGGPLTPQAKTGVARNLRRAVVTVPGVIFAGFAYVYLGLPDVRPLKATNPSTTAFIEAVRQDPADRLRPGRERPSNPYEPGVEPDRLSRLVEDLERL